MSKFNVGDRIRTKVRMGNIPKETNGVVSYVYPDGDLAIHFSGSNSLTMYLPSECEMLSTIDLTDLDAEAVEKVKEFADSLRKQDPPTEDDKYIWIESYITELGYEITFDESVLATRIGSGKYVYGHKSFGHFLSKDDEITKWRPARVS